MIMRPSNVSIHFNIKKFLQMESRNDSIKLIMGSTLKDKKKSSCC
jgi:hypothetical protein